MDNHLTFRRDTIRELATQLTSAGLLLSWRIMKEEGVTREAYLQMCGEVWDEIQGIETEDS